MLPACVHLAPEERAEWQQLYPALGVPPDARPQEKFAASFDLTHQRMLHKLYGSSSSLHCHLFFVVSKLCYVHFRNIVNDSFIHSLFYTFEEYLFTYFEEGVKVVGSQ